MIRKFKLINILKTAHGMKKLCTAYNMYLITISIFNFKRSFRYGMNSTKQKEKKTIDGSQQVT